MTYKLNIGDPAPSFEGMDGEGNKISSKSLQGRPFVLYFYPKDDTPGCTKEACHFRDLKPGFDQHKVELIGVSPDTPDSHQKFAVKYGLNFKLVSDPNHQICKSFDVWQEKESFGKISMGIIRTTFIIDKKGIIRWMERPVQVEGHADRVLEALKTIK